MGRLIHLLIILVLFFPSLGLAHAVSTHIRLTNAAVDFLVQVDPRFIDAADALKQILAIGSEHEDDWIRRSRVTGRFFFHFFPNLVSTSLRLFATCDSLEWGFEDNQCTVSTPLGSDTITNTFRWNDALRLASGDQGWTALGYVIHLLEDLTVPAHVRNDPHPHLLSVGPMGIHVKRDTLWHQPVNAMA